MLRHLFFCLLCTFRISFAEHKSTDHNYPLIFMFSTPRSISTAFMRMMIKKGFIAIHEPFGNMKRIERMIKEGKEKEIEPNAFRNYNDIKKVISSSLKQGPVFVKEMYTGAHLYLNDLELMNYPNIRFIILVRSPHATILSFYKKQIILNDRAAPPGQPKGRWWKEEGKQHLTNTMYKKLHEVYKTIKNKTTFPVVIIKAEDLYTKTEHTLSVLCKRLNLTFNPDMLHWQNLYSKPLPLNWIEHKKQKNLDLWHDDALKSTCFKKPSTYEVDAQGNPTWKEIIHPDDKKLCCNAYHDNMPHYSLLIQEPDVIT